MDLLQEVSLKNVLPGEFENFKYISSKVLNIHGPTNEEYARCNQSPFTSKQLRKAIMTRLVFLINIGKIIVPGISLLIKDKEIFVLSF